MKLKITDVQWILGHRHLSTTQVYLNPLPEDVIASAVAYFQRRGQPAPATAAPGTEPGAAPVYDPASLRGMAIVLGWLADQPGGSWQDRWLAAGAEDDPAADWRLLPLAWNLRGS